MIAGPIKVVIARLTIATAASDAGIIASIARMNRVHPPICGSAMASMASTTMIAVTSAIVPR